MTKIITAILAVGCIMLGVGISATSCPAMAAQPQQEWAQPAHKAAPHKPAPKAVHTVPAKPVEAPAPVVCPEYTVGRVVAIEPPPAPRERDAVPTAQPSYWERAKAHADKGWWLLWSLGGLLIGGALAILFNTGRTVYAGYKASKGTTTA